MRDLTTGPIGWTLFTFSLPVLGTSILQSLNGSANAFWVSRSLGEVALAATSNANLILFLLLGVGFGASMSANLLVGQAAGAKDFQLAKRVVGTSVLFFLALSVTIAIVGVVLTPKILHWVNTPADARDQAIAYLRVVFLAVPPMYFMNFMMMAQRGLGDSRTPFWFSVLGIGLDIVFNPILILGLGPFPELGIAGSSTAMLIGQVVTLISMTAWLYSRGSLLVLKPADWGLMRPDPAILRSLVFKGLPMAGQMMVMSGAALVMVSLVNRYGSQTSAAYGAASQIWGYVQMPAMAVGAAVSSMAAQYVGAGKIDRLSRVALIGIVLAVVMTMIPVGATYLFGRQLLQVFLPATSPALDIAVHINSVIVWGFILFGATFVMFGVVRATGAVTPPLIILAISLWGVRVPFATLMLPYMGPDAIWWSFPMGSALSMLLGLLYWRFGNWRNQRMLDELPRGEIADAGMSPPAMVEDEPAADVSRSAPSAPHRPAS